MKKRKALSTYDMIYWMARILFVTFMLITIYFVANIYESQALDTSKVEAQLFEHYLFYSPNSISYSDPYTGRIYPGVLDIKNFDEERLNKAANFGEINNMVAANITLRSASQINLAGDLEKPEIVASVVYNQEKYERWIQLVPIPQFGTGVLIKGPGTVFSHSAKRYVVYFDEEGNQKYGEVETKILVPKT